MRLDLRLDDGKNALLVPALNYGRPDFRLLAKPIGPAQGLVEVLEGVGQSDEYDIGAVLPVQTISSDARLGDDHPLRTSTEAVELRFLFFRRVAPANFHGFRQEPLEQVGFVVGVAPNDRRPVVAIDDFSGSLAARPVGNPHFLVDRRGVEACSAE